ncbi:EboA domain-containing protein [Streptomyces fulvoviolaceus]|uniref:EboA domain-containing protein n=1 Tax=Streptomyces fulvoviolaceus TaxID=285535 RepID=UPI0021C11F3D|nr:EboA domain-containing protein [Streptomyces fulvoviolaceus]MCT9082387.1 EboA domain-containing protein [Streptomyces fulvoviolaceus]
MEPHIPTALDRQLTLDAQRWLTDAVARVGQDPAAVRTVFPAVGRHCGRGPLAAGWTVADAARARLVAALPLRGGALAEEVTDLHRYGDAAEQRAVLRSLALLDEADASFADLGLPLVRAALRGNDTDLIEAALGPYAARRLDHDGYRHAVLKCVFCGIPLDRIAGLDERADRELARMLADFAHERVAAGRDVPADIWPVVRAHPGTLEASGLPEETDSPVPERRDAAVRALAAFTATAPAGAA